MAEAVIAGGSGGTGSDECTATRDKVLAGYAAVTRDSDDEAAEGTMPDQGDWTGTVGMNGTLAVPGGHHSGNGKVSGPAVTQRGAWGTAIGVNGSVVVPEGYHNGGGVVSNSTPVMGGQTINPAPYQQAVYCAGNYMNGHIVINPIPANFIDYTAGQVVFNYGATGMLGPFVPKYVTVTRNGTSSTNNQVSLEYDAGGPKFLGFNSNREAICFSKTFNTQYFKRVRIIIYAPKELDLYSAFQLFFLNTNKYYTDGWQTNSIVISRESGDITMDFTLPAIWGQVFLTMKYSCSYAGGGIGSSRIKYCYLRRVELLP